MIYHKGDRVRLKTNKAVGIVRKTDSDGGVTVQVGLILKNIPAAELEIIAAPTVSLGGIDVIREEKATAVSTQISVRQMTVADALMILEKYLDNALLAGHRRVTVIHGRGTHTLHDAVNDYLKRCPFVRGLSAGAYGEGGAGVTIVELDAIHSTTDRSPGNMTGIRGQ